MRVIEFFRERKGIIVIAVVAAAVLTYVLLNQDAGNYAEKYVGYNFGVLSQSAENSYASYSAVHAGTPAGGSEIETDIFGYTSSEGTERLENFEGAPRALLTSESGFAEYEFDVPSDGMYNIYIEYFPVESRGADAERALEINGALPFNGAESLIFERVWGDASAVSRFDNQGNQIRPAQTEKPSWQSAYLKDRMGYFAEPYAFYFEKGANTVKLTGVNEPLVIRKIALKPIANAPDYKTYLAGFDLGVYKNSNISYSQIIQGETAARQSSPSLYGVYDRSSGATSPASAAKITLNMIGGQSWRVAGQWIEWDAEIPEDGLYKIEIKGRQSYNRGFVSHRSLLIDGEIPCAETNALAFRYGNKWSVTSPSDENGEELLFPLTKGTHSLRLSVTMGGLGKLLNDMNESVYRLNAVYRRILVLTGASPDPYRDYRIDEIYPDVMENMSAESKFLYKLVDDLTNYTGERGSQAASALTLANHLEVFVKHPDKIPAELVSFKSQVSALSDGMLALSQSQLDIDYIIISAPQAETHIENENFFTAAAHEVKSFAASFVADYNQLGDKYEGGDITEVWVTAGRDQSTIVKSMIDEIFTPETGVRVNLKLVGADALMPAVVAGTGPDAVLSAGSGDPVNYAVRGAAQDLSKFDGFSEVEKRFADSAMTPFRFDGGTYALPETQGFHVMFYRTDILAQLGLEPPSTWEDLIDILLVIQKNNMNVAVPVANAGDFTMFYAHLYQRGGQVYSNNGAQTLLDSEESIAAFTYYTKFFTHYQTPVIYDFVNRFRSGELPLGFADFTVFNTLEVFAPEIRGLWSFGLMPGTVGADGSINRSVPSGGTACIMFANADNKDATWEFLKWWVSADVQTRYGRELEALLGSAARYATANTEAFGRLAWSSAQREVLDEQRAYTVGTPEVPGGYYTARHFVNAFRQVINTGADTRETMLDYCITINDELLKKRIEFGLERK